MSYQKQNFMNYLHNNNYANPGVYCNALDNVEKLFFADIDAEFERDQCESLYNEIQRVRKVPEQIGKSEHDVRIYASRLNKYIEFMTGGNVESNFTKKINKLIVEYKKDFNKINEQEIYKWKALKHYKDNWDIDAPDFAGMVERAFAKTYNLLAAGQYFARKMLEGISKEHPEEVRALFKMLYDESLPLAKRFDDFRAGFDAFVEEKQINHYQDLHAISVYLTFEFPEKYYIYKYGVWTDFLENIGESAPSTKGKHETFKIESSNKICDDILSVILEDNELCSMSQSRLDSTCYSDPTYRMLAFDIMFYGSYSKKETYNWAAVYTPLNLYLHTFFTERWEQAKMKWEAVKTFQENWDIDSKNFIEMFNKSTKTSSFISLSRGVSKRTVMYFAEQDVVRTKNLFEVLYDENLPLEIRSETFYNTLNELAIKYDRPTHDRTAFVYLFLRYPEKYYVYKSNDMLALKRKVSGNDNLQQSGSQTQKMLESYALLDEIKSKVSENSEFCEIYFDFIHKEGYTDDGLGILVSDLCEWLGNLELPQSSEDEDVSYWLYSPGEGAFNWSRDIETGTMALGWDFLGDFRQYDSDEEIIAEFHKRYNDDSSHKNDKCAVWDFANMMKVGDIVFAKKGVTTIIGKGIVQSDYYYDESLDKYRSLRKVQWTDIGEWEHPGNAVVKTLTDITKYKDYLAKLLAIFDGVSETTSIEKVIEPYTKADFLKDVYISEEKYETCVSRLKHKKNLILQGAPGVGKTFAARRLAWSMMGYKNDKRVEFVQFHQSYSYEDFIMGYKPDGASFNLEYGIFYNFCTKAKNDPNNDYFFIIDEINRGNMSKIFGELLMLIESDYRRTEITLAYDKKPFSVPENLYIIGMMNTADRSLAMIDYALRRRFSFVEMAPGFDSEGFETYQNTINNDTFNRLIGKLKALNADIESDPSLGKGFCIGHSYFCNLDENCTDAVLKEVVEYDIIPMLEEYWFDEEAKATRWSNDLRGVFNG